MVAIRAHAVCLLAVIAAMLAVGCSGKQSDLETKLAQVVEKNRALETQVAALQSEHAILKQDDAILKQNLEGEVKALKDDSRMLQGYLERDKGFFLYLLDYDLDAVDKGELHPRGRFSDFFVPNLHGALRAGATREEVGARLDRLIALAKRGSYLSGSVKDLMGRGGAMAIREYANLK